MTIKIPTGSRDGDAYDGYAAAEDYAMKCEAKRAKQAEKERKSAERKSKGSKWPQGRPGENFWKVLDKFRFDMLIYLCEVKRNADWI